MIRTPDQRVRVFVSSTLQEVADERKVVKKAIEDLHLTPVMFESGARPHPPRLLYQSYLQQSDIFIGIYWNSYGWISEDMTISGLEDEYQLSQSKPRLIYIKSSERRESKLKELIGEIQKQGDVSYKPFNNLEELKQFVTNDLASLLSERFLGSNGATQVEKNIFFNTIPIPFHELIGREQEMQTLEDLLCTQRKRLVTLTGMGGTGKSRLAIEIAHKALSRFKNGACFVSLASIKEHTQMEGFIALTFDLTDSSKQSMRETLLSYLSDKNLLLVLDNFEHVLDGANLVSDILSRSREVSILVTSRSPLNLRAEHLFPLSPLALPAQQPLELSEALEVPVLKLFIERTKSVNPNINWDKETLHAAFTICERLGGLPLAVELVAMRFKHSTPVNIIHGMQKSLNLLTGGARDLPDRQKSFRATLTWSYELLSDLDKSTFKVSSLFQNGLFPEALATVCNIPLEECESSIERLIDVGLIRVRSMEGSTGRYDNLQPIKEYAEELFEDDPKAKHYREAFINYYVAAASALNHYAFYEPSYAAWTDFVKIDYENIRTAFRLSMKTGVRKNPILLINSCCSYWMFAGLQHEGLSWINESGINQLTEWQLLPPSEIKIFAFNFLYAGAFNFYLADFPNATKELWKAKDMFEFVKDEVGVARCYLYLALTGLSCGDPKCKHYFEEALRLGKANGDNPSVFLSVVLLIEVYSQTGNFQKAKDQIEEAEQLLIHRKPGKEFYGVDDLQTIFYLVKANICLVTHNLEGAYEAYNTSIKLYEEKRLKTSWAFALEGLSVIHLLRGEIDLSQSVALQGLNKGREQGDIIVILSTLRILISCLLAKNQNKDLLDLLSEIDAHFYELKYRFWAIDTSASNWLKDLFIEKNIQYIFEPRPKRMSLDELIQAILIYFK